MAAPQVAGVAALALAAHPELGPDELISLLRRSVHPWTDINFTPPIADDPLSRWYRYDMDYFGPGVRSSLMGTGVIDAALAVTTDLVSAP
jgi:subtilisin family serine protease